VPNVACSDYQNHDVNLGSRSDTILIGTPSNSTTSLTYNSTRLSMDIFWLIGIKCAYLVNRSTMTQIESCPLTNLDRCVIKSMEMLSHFHCGMLKGSNVPPDLWCSNFAFWHTKQDAIKSTMSIFIPVHQKDSFRSLYILVIPECMLRQLLWPSSKIFFLSRGPGTHTYVLEP